MEITRMNNQKGLVEIIALVLVAALFSASAWYFYSNQTSSHSEQTPSPTPQNTIDTSDWLTYTNEKHGFAMQYPTNWYLRDEPFASSFSYSQSFSYQKEHDPAQLNINDVVTVRIYDNQFDASSLGIHNWDSPSDFFNAIKSLPLNTAQELNASLLTYSVIVTKLEDLNDNSVTVNIVPGPNSATEPFDITSTFYLNEDTLYELFTSIHENDSHYSTALKIIESFKFID